MSPESQARLGAFCRQLGHEQALPSSLAIAQGAFIYLAPLRQASYFWHAKRHPPLHSPLVIPPSPCLYSRPHLSFGPLCQPLNWPATSYLAPFMLILCSQSHFSNCWPAANGFLWFLEKSPETLLWHLGFSKTGQCSFSLTWNSSHMCLLSSNHTELLDIFFFFYFIPCCFKSLSHCSGYFFLSGIFPFFFIFDTQFKCQLFDLFFLYSLKLIIPSLGLSHLSLYTLYKQ